MWIMLVILGCIVAVCVLPAVYSWYDDLAAAKRGKTAAGDATTAGSPLPRPESLEGVLVAQLAEGEITRGQYIRAMAKLAARDDERHPLAVPPEQGAAGV
ncbi:hypothetical protein AB0J83_18600 [Actinoplanes sp. NPDC049596]|uniref:hypothetical protein n=1 Tax=unclassified Actinoplanes TaxID=2626549 RepID=UPI003448ADAE